MEINILLPDEVSPVEDVLFNTTDYADSSYTQDDVVADIEDAILSLKTAPQRKAVFVLDSPVEGLSIKDIYLRTRSLAKAQGIKTLRISVRSADIRDYLLNRLPPFDPLREEFHLFGKTLTFLTGDITEVEADAIVNASNTRLVLGAGVSGTIRGKAGLCLQEQMSIIAAKKNLGPGDVALTSSYDLITCRFIIHAATADGSEISVSKAVVNTLKLCLERGIRSVAFPALGTGTGGLSMGQCARITVHEILQHWEKNAPNSDPQMVHVVLWTPGAFNEFIRTLQEKLF